MDTASMPHITLKTPASSGTDPMLAAALLSKNDGGMFGGGTNGLLPLLIGAFLFGGNRGLWGMGGAGPAGAGAFAAEAVAAQSIYTPKDTAAQLNTFQSWAQNNAAQLAQQCCCSTQQILSAVCGLGDKMFQTFVAQAAAQTAQLNNMQASMTANATANHDATSAHLNSMEENLNEDVHDVEKQMSAGFAAGQLAECHTQNLINANKADSDFKNAKQFCDLAKQLAECCCENRLAIANQNALIERNTAALQNQISRQTCDIEKAISADGQATRALITANSMDDLRGKLADAKTALSNANQTRDLEALIESTTRRHCGGYGYGQPPVSQTVNVTDVATAVARALQQAGPNKP